MKKSDSKVERSFFSHSDVLLSRITSRPVIYYKKYTALFLTCSLVLAFLSSLMVLSSLYFLYAKGTSTEVYMTTSTGTTFQYKHSAERQEVLKKYKKYKSSL